MLTRTRSIARFFLESLENRVLLSAALSQTPLNIAALPQADIMPAAITDQQKQQLILQMVDTHCGVIPPELVLAEIRQEGGAGAFFADGALYNTFYTASQAPWAQPDDNGDGIMQVTSASGFHQASGSYTDDQAGYDHAISDGCGYFSQTENAYGTAWQATLHYNTGPSSLYIYLGINGGDRQYLAHVASDLQSFVPSIYALSDAVLVGQLNAAQQIVNTFLANKAILSGQTPAYYAPFETQLDNQLHALGPAGAVTDTWTGASSNQWNNKSNWSTGAVPGATNSVEINNGSAQSTAAINVAHLILSNAALQLAAGAGQSAFLTLTIEGNATLDLTTNRLNINYGPNASPVASVAAYLTSGYNGGSWNGIGIVSSAAASSAGMFSVGYFDSSADKGTGAPPHQVAIQYTLAGDAFLENTVGFDDLVVVAQNFGFSGKDWSGGNFNYDPTGAVGFADLVNIAQNFGFTSGQSQGLPAHPPAPPTPSVMPADGLIPDALVAVWNIFSPNNNPLFSQSPLLA